MIPLRIFAFTRFAQRGIEAFRGKRKNRELISTLTIRALGESLLILTAVTSLSAAPTLAASPSSPPSPVADGRVATLDPSDLRDFDLQPAPVRQLLTQALQMTKLGLSYRYGSDDPVTGGMDCSGTIYHLLQGAGVRDVPRDSGEIYRWVWTKGRFQAVVSSNPNTFELARLKPGDLLFWADTYKVERDPPVSHVMIYLGVNRATGRPVMMGASEGRRFNDISRYGVSVFDFVLPRPADPAGGAPAPRFIGYASIPGLTDSTRTGL
jgi:cell wall-associated NlpC family hydrolase